MNKDCLLEVRDVTKRFGGLTAVNKVSLHVNAGEICSLIGPNGAGKTTLFNVVSGVLRPSEGAVLFKGKDMAGAHPASYAAAGMGRTFQNLALFKNSTVVENLLVGRHTHIRTNALQSMLFYGRARHEEAKRSSASSSSWRSKACATRWWGRCLTGSKSGWSWAGPWPASPSFCCSTRSWRA